MLWAKNTRKDFVRADTKSRQPSSFQLLVADIRDERHVACSLNSDSKLTLMISAGSGDSSGKDLGALAYALGKSFDVLVINVLDLVCTELANLSALASVHYGTCRCCLGSCLNGLLGCVGYNYFVIHYSSQLFRYGKCFSFHKFEKGAISRLEREIVLV